MALHRLCRQRAAQCDACSRNGVMRPQSGPSVVPFILVRLHSRFTCYWGDPALHLSSSAWLQPMQLTINGFPGCHSTSNPPLGAAAWSISSAACSLAASCCTRSSLSYLLTVTTSTSGLDFTSSTCMQQQQQHAASSSGNRTAISGSPAAASTGPAAAAS